MTCIDLMPIKIFNVFDNEFFSNNKAHLDFSKFLQEKCTLEYGEGEFVFQSIAFNNCAQGYI